MKLLLYRSDADEAPICVKVDGAKVDALAARYRESGYDVVTVATADESKFPETRAA